MPESDPLQILLCHDRWATLQLLGVCGRLSPEQFERRFDIGPGSLRDTVTHIIGAMRAWTETLAGQEARPRLEADGQRRTPEQLRSLFDEAWPAFSDESTRRPLGETVVRRLKDGTTVELTRSAVLVHVTTHGMHHRAQCLNMLRQVGADAMPKSSVAEWTWMADGRG